MQTREQAVALRVVGEAALPGPREDVGFGQQARAVASGTLEEVGEFSDVLDAGLRVAIAACELSDQDAAAGAPSR